MRKNFDVFVFVGVALSTVAFVSYQVIATIKFHNEQERIREQIRIDGILSQRAYERAGEFLRGEMKAGRYMPSSLEQLQIDIEALAMGYRAEG